MRGFAQKMIVGGGWTISSEVFAVEDEDFLAVFLAAFLGVFLDAFSNRLWPLVGSGGARRRERVDSGGLHRR